MAVDTPGKFVIVVNEALPPGLAANTAAVLSLTVGEHAQGVLGSEVHDADGTRHPGITQIPIPILSCCGEDLRSLREAALPLEDVFVCGFTTAAQRARRYSEYAETMAATPACDLEYAGVALYGQAAAVKRLTGSISLFR